MVGLFGFPNLHFACICENSWMDDAAGCNCFCNKFSFVLDWGCWCLYVNYDCVSENPSSNECDFVWR